MKLNRLFIAVTFALVPVITDAQEIAIGNDDKQPIEERVIYSHENTMHATLHSRGLSLGYRGGKIRSIYKTTNWEIELSYLRSQKQIQLTNLFSASSYVYGKLNDVVVLRGGYEVERRIYGKPYWGGVEVRWHYGFGASIALLKPYYYTVVVAQNASGQNTETVKYDTFENSLQWIDILGKAPLRYGFNEIKVRPGIYAKGGLSFEIGTSKTRAQSVEVGAMMEYFPQGLALMAENPPEYVIPTFYLSYSWGYRFNKY